MLDSSIEILEEGQKSISSERKSLLDSIAKRLLTDSNLNALNFVCTHNSRRSQFAQIWAFVLSNHYQIRGLGYYSGGTMLIACHPNVLKALESFGIDSEQKTQGENPHYLIQNEAKEANLEIFSKTYDHPSNPSSNFVAIMTCDHADENCPFIPGASARFSLHYRDPKRFDGTKSELVEYQKTALQIGTELHYLIKTLSIGKK